MYSRAHLLSIPVTRHRHLQISIMTMSVIYRHPLIAIVIVSHLPRLAIVIHPTLRNVTLARSTEDGVPHCRYHLSRRHTATTRKISRIHLSLPTYTRRSTHNRRLISKYLTDLCTMTSTIRQLAEKIWYRHHLAIKSVCIRLSVEIQRKSVQSTAHLHARMISSNVLRAMHRRI